MLFLNIFEPSIGGMGSMLKEPSPTFRENPIVSTVVTNPLIGNKIKSAKNTSAKARFIPGPAAETTMFSWAGSFIPPSRIVARSIVSSGCCGGDVDCSRCSEEERSAKNYGSQQSQEKSQGPYLKMSDVAMSDCHELVPHFMENETREGSNERPRDNGEINCCAREIVVEFSNRDCNGDYNPRNDD